MNLVKDLWSKNDINEFLEYLKIFSKGEEKGFWEQRIVNTKLPCLAIPSTEIDKISKQIYKGNYISFLDLWIWNNHSATLVFGKILNKIKDFELLSKYLIPYSEKSDNWSTIDCLKFSFSEDNYLKFIKLSKDLIKSKHTFSRRLALIILLNAILPIAFGVVTLVATENVTYLLTSIQFHQLVELILYLNTNQQIHNHYQHNHRNC